MFFVYSSILLRCLFAFALPKRFSYVRQAFSKKKREREKKENFLYLLQLYAKSVFIENGNFWELFRKIIFYFSPSAIICLDLISSCWWKISRNKSSNNKTIRKMKRFLLRKFQTIEIESFLAVEICFCSFHRLNLFSTTSNSIFAINHPPPRPS